MGVVVVVGGGGVHGRRRSGDCGGIVVHAGSVD